MQVKFFDDKIEYFLGSLDLPLRSKITGLIILLGQHGHQIGIPHSKGLGNGLFELRTLGRPQVRIFYTFFHGEAVLLHGFLKDTKHIPLKELTMARRNKHYLEQV